MQEPSLNNPFWQYAVQTYQIEDVAEYLLSLQDTHELDVNLILLSAWAAEQQYHLSQTTWLALLAAAAPWQQTIDLLRSARRNLKQQSEPLYQQAKALELACEQRYIAALYEKIQDCTLEPNAQASYEQNLAVYLQQCGVAETALMGWSLLDYR